jgi:3-deoxy-D-manno-octulosonic-acid transferase
MRFFYTIGIHFYWFAIRLASLFNDKAKKMIVGRRNWAEDLKQQLPKTEKLYWFHCSSLGEFEQARPVLEEIKRKQANVGILLSFFSPSGYEIRKNYEVADYVCYLPADTPKNAKRFLDIVKPDMAIFVKYEFWYNFIKQIHKRNISLYYFSVIFRAKQHFFKAWGKWFAMHLHKINHIFVQNKESVVLANSIGVSNISLCGDTRFDRVQGIAKNPKKFKVVEDFIAEKKVLLMGSSWTADEKVFVEYYEKYKDDFKLIIVPHHTDEARIKQIVERFSDSIRFTDVENRTLNEVEKGKGVLIVDTIGILSSLYQYADVAYIGNGFGSGIHNTLEAAVYALPVVFGPHYHKFQEAVDLVEEGGAFSFKNNNELETILQRLFNDKAAYDDAAQICKEYVAENLGATEKILAVLVGNA